MNNLKIKTKEEVQTKEILHKWKRWFNGAKYFFTVHPQPPKTVHRINGEYIRTKD